ncbi:MAG: arylsulfatase [Deltaproteobacteria bacterium]|nr:MAG: arylsulfatase [Deltaproteobacteria bacterium]
MSLVLTLNLGTQSALAAETRPNILLIVVDDMGYSDLGAFGGEIKTPNIDSLAAAGVKFTDFYVGPTCSPTRSMLMSGNDNHIAGLGNMREALTPNQVGQSGYEGYLNDRVVSVAELLRDAGYHTYMAGKWHLGEEPEHDPSRRGFEKSFTLLQGGASHFDDEWMMYANYTPTYRENGVRVHVPPGFYSTRFYTDKIIKYIDEQEDKRPFFAYLSFTAVHDPLHLPDDWLDRYDGVYDGGYNSLRKQRLARMKKLGIIPKEASLGPWLAMVPRWEKLNTEQQEKEARRMEIYAAMVSNVDFHVGRLLDSLEKAGQKKNTLVIFFSDNGANGLEMHMYPGTDNTWVERNSDNRLTNWGRRGSRIAQGPGWAQASSTPFRLFKAFIAEGGIRSPLIINGPGVARAGETIHAVSHVMDIAPTLLHIAGTEYPSTYHGRSVVPIRGKSMLPLLNKRSAVVRGPDEAIAWEFNDWRAIRIGDFKATWISRPFGTSEWQLFDLAVDPGEKMDLSGQKPGVTKQLVSAWAEYAKDVGVVAPEKTAWPDQ